MNNLDEKKGKSKILMALINISLSLISALAGFIAFNLLS